jgi:single-stranded DNA-binding protein
MINIIVIEGRVMHTPTLITQKSGRKELQLTICNNRYYYKGPDQHVEHTVIHAYIPGPLGERISTMIEHGTKILISGRMEDQHRVNVREVKILDRAKIETDTDIEIMEAIQ